MCVVYIYIYSIYIYVCVCAYIHLWDISEFAGHVLPQFDVHPPMSLGRIPTTPAAAPCWALRILRRKRLKGRLLRTCDIGGFMVIYSANTLASEHQTKYVGQDMT